MILEELSKVFYNMQEVIAVALSGSATNLINDNYSDYDIYVYYKDTPPDRAMRRETLQAFGQCNIGLDFFEEGDELFPLEGRSVDIMYRSIDWIKAQIDEVWISHKGRIGYTTCFIHNVKSSKILFDKTGELTELKRICSYPYPKELREDIIKKNLMLIDGDTLAPYIKQIKLAATRGDFVSLLHRTTALLASYFDILFAYSYQLHPGEKKLMGYIKALKVEVPQYFERDLQNILSSIEDAPKLLDALSSLLENLHSFLEL